MRAFRYFIQNPREVDFVVYNKTANGFLLIYTKYISGFLDIGRCKSDDPA